jgi:N-acetyl sugar amidotransferase
MNPLTVTWAPILYTDYGYKNFKNWIEIGGFDNITLKPNGRVQRLLTKLSIENLFHPFQTFILGQKNLAPKIAAQYGIELIFYGENEAEYGNPIADNNLATRSSGYFSYDSLDEIYLGGVSVNELINKYELSLNDLEPYLPLKKSEIENSRIQVYYLGYYLKWLPQEAYYYAVKNTGFKARPFRTQGTYSKYNSIDDKIDDLHYYTTYIKFGIGRATYDASQEIRNRHITREEGIVLVNRFDGEFPDRYFDEVMEYLGIDPNYFRNELTDKFRPDHLWIKVEGQWKLRHKA